MIHEGLHLCTQTKIHIYTIDATYLILEMDLVFAHCCEATLSCHAHQSNSTYDHKPF